MKRTITLGLFILVLMAHHTQAQPVSDLTANKVAEDWISRHDRYSIRQSSHLADIQGNVLAHEFDLSPDGYLVLTADQGLPPVIAYSFNSTFSTMGERYNPLKDMLVRDIANRMIYLDLMPEDEKELNRSQWELYLQAGQDDRFFEQWPPPGSTSTGGWLETNWKQSHPYNKFCPMDNVNSARSVAGCPAVALAMIIHYQENLNGTRFDDSDDYYHSYAGRQYWIDDDSHGWDFPNFPDLNGYFESIEVKFQEQTPINEDEIAALIFGCGAAAKQVYTSEVSGTFGVNQAYDAYLRFGYEDASLVYDSDTSFYTQMKDNIKDALPVHLAVLSNTGQGGHNVVADGYNTDDYYHLNFGWGGSYNGWYLLPEEIPYNLTIIEGAVMDIGIEFVTVPEALEKNNNSIHIYPNPAKDILYINFPEMEANDAVIQVFRPDGKSALEEQVRSGKAIIEVDLSHLQPGMYICHVRTGNCGSACKLIVE